MKFFLPGYEDEDRAWRVYQGIWSYAGEYLHWAIKDKKIFSIRYVRDGVEHYAEVGKVDDYINELVMAIFESYEYVICTSDHGAKRGEPVVISRTDVKDVVYFE